MIPEINLQAHQRLYFASDFHLGYPDHATSLQRERKIIRWLDAIQDTAAHIFLMGDLFEFWFEYKYVVPKGAVRLLGKIAELTDGGVPVSIFTGNHDLWIFTYFTQELGTPVYHKPQSFTCNGKKFLIGHGDGLGPGDIAYKLLKKYFFRVNFFQWCFDKLPAFVGMNIAYAWSRQSKKKGNAHYCMGEDEWIWQYCQKKHQENPHHFYIFGHRHFPLDLTVTADNCHFSGRYLNLGEWIHFCTYVTFDGTDAKLLSFENTYALLPTAEKP
ncbi:MAG: UDP-2,3-diacylglucosamine diphosphatase [Cytophagales bacterium]|nr:UDP-2,3-diacylglucosamine diphosphatase [Bernardetiaceae bacterium]MDW8205855.1 UDP-2,3-diacylglucosamine diphosphatase [Cytophagales bacterium]